MQNEKMKLNIKTMTYQEWNETGKRRFGKDRMVWRFVCPVCGIKASAQDWIDVGAPEGSIGFSCIGRWSKTSAQKAFSGRKKKKGEPCDYAGGGLFPLNPIRVISPDGNVFPCFDFADSEE